MIPPGGEYVYEFGVHEEGTFSYQSHVPMQEAFGLVGWFIIHPNKVWDPPVDLIPESARVPRNTELIAVARASSFEFVADNPGDRMLHCHTVHHMVNHMVKQVGPRIRERDVPAYMSNSDNRPRVNLSPTAVPAEPPDDPQGMRGMRMRPAAKVVIPARRISGAPPFAAPVSDPTTSPFAWPPRRSDR